MTRQRKAWDAASGKQMKIFGCGESMGGGVLATIMLSKPDYYDGHILISPMLEIAEETRHVKPHQHLVNVRILVRASEKG